jgi:hypothetical protein
MVNCKKSTNPYPFGSAIEQKSLDKVVHARDAKRMV